ncbi:MAG: hypothetical protein WDM92_05650 [Caulobacteraceae bacterium]
MKHFNHQTYLTEEEAAFRLGITADELLTLVLESGRPSHTVHGGEHLYLQADVERMAEELQS